MVRDFFKNYPYHISVEVPSSNPPVKDRVNCVNAVLLNQAGARRLMVDPKCKQLLLDFERVQWKADLKGNSLPDIDKSDHARKVDMGIGQLLDSTDFHVEAIDLLGNRQGCEVGVALFVAVHSALKKRSVLPALLILGDMSTLTLVNLQFDLKSGGLLGNTALALFNGQISPGGQWAFSAIFMSFDGQRIVTRIDTGLLQATAIENGASKRIVQPVKFDPLFHPSNRKERKEWEKLYGPRQR